MSLSLSSYVKVHSVCLQSLLDVWNVKEGPQEGHEKTVPILCSGNYDDNGILKPGGSQISIEVIPPIPSLRVIFL